MLIASLSEHSGEGATEYAGAGKLRPNCTKKGETMKYERNPHNVANNLKGIVNGMCEEGFEWYPDVKKGQGMSLWDICYAIEILEKAEVQSFEIVDDVTPNF